MEEVSTKTTLEIIASTLAVAATILVVYLLIISSKVPLDLMLRVPFTTQAPTDNWNRNEDCEETSIAMATAFLNGQSEDRMPATDAQNAIKALKNWELINIGYNANTGADATTQMAVGAFGLKVQQIQDYTELDLKKALAAGHVVLLPIDARQLHNPKYAKGGPLYHMIVVRGYRGDIFIVNDPGTDSGDGNEYAFTTLQNAAADWDQAAQALDPARKIALVLAE